MGTFEETLRITPRWVMGGVTCSGFQLVKEKSCSEGQMALFSWERCSEASGTKHGFDWRSCTIDDKFCEMFFSLLTHERGRKGGRLWGRGGVGGSGLQKCHVGREEELAAAVLAKEDWQEDSSSAALVKG